MAVLFDALTEYILVADNAKWDFTPCVTHRSFSFYYRCDTALAAGEWQNVLRFNGGTDLNFSITFYNQGAGVYILVQLTADSGATLAYFVAPANAMTVGNWYHIAIIHDAVNECAIYQNGSALTIVGYGTWTNSTAWSVAYTVIGNPYTAYAFALAHFSIFSDLLTSTEVNNLKANPYCMDSDSAILASWHLDEGTGTNAKDIQTVATQTDGTLNNGPTWTPQPPGQSYTKTLSESMAISEVLRKGFGRPRSDSIVPSEVYARIVARARVYSDAGVLGEVYSRSAVRSRTLSDTFTISEIFTKTTAKLLAFLDSVVTGEVYSRVAARARTLSDTITTSEVYSRVAALLRSLADALTATDIFSQTQNSTPPDPSSAILDNFNRADANSLGSNWSRGFGDYLGVFGINANQMDIYSQVSGYTQAYWNPATFGPAAWARIKIADWGDGLSRINLSIKMQDTDSQTTSTGYTATLFGPNHITHPNRCCLKWVADAVSHVFGDEPAGDIPLEVNVADGDEFAITYKNGVLYAWHKPVSTGEWYIAHSVADTLFENQTGNALVYAHAATGGADLLLEDFGAGTIGVHISNFSELMTMLDSMTKSAGKSFLDTITGSEVYARAAARIRTLSDAITTSEVYSRASALKRTLTDSITTSEAFLRAITRACSETISLTESIVKSVARRISETISLLETYVQELAHAGTTAFTKLFTETINLSETYSRVAALARTLSESFSLSEIYARAAAIKRTLSETLSITGTIVRRITKVLSETFNISEIYARVRTIARTFVESITASEVYARAAAIKRSLSDSITTAESFVIGIINEYVKSFTETLTIADSFIKTIGNIWAKKLYSTTAWQKTSKTVTSWARSVKSLNIWNRKH